MNTKTTTSAIRPAEWALGLCVVALCLVSLGWMLKRNEAEGWKVRYEAEVRQNGLLRLQAETERGRAEDATRANR